LERPASAARDFVPHRVRDTRKKENAMGDFRSFKTARREPAGPGQPVIDPADWKPEALKDVDNWSYRLSERDADELAEGVAAVRRSGVALVDIKKDDFPLKGFGEVMLDVRRELLNGRGIVMMRNFPLDRFDREGTAIAYIGLGAWLGNSLSQNKFGHILGHVKDLGGDYNDPNTRGYMTNDEMGFHTDACDYVGLLCLQRSMTGGESRIASSVTVYNRILATRPDLAKVLTEPFYRSRTGEVSEGQLPYFPQPIISFTEGYFSAIGLSAAVLKAQDIPGVPKFTPAQKEVFDVYRKTIEESALDIDFQRGDIQFLNNFVMMHTRRGYEDWPDPARKRHLLRLWLRDPNGRPISKEQREGRVGTGVNIAGVKRIAPLEAEAA
jgi:hypothetical protein